MNNKVAIIGIDINLPSSPNIEEFWKLINSKNTGIKFQKGSSESLSKFEANSGKYIPKFGSIDDVFTFDAPFWNIKPQEARIMDPQHRKSIESVWKAIEDSCEIQQLSSKEVSVYAVTGRDTYLINNVMSNNDLLNNIGIYQMLTATYPDFLASKISYLLNLHGPSLTLGSACSSSLVAIYYAYQDLISRNSDLAIVTASAIRVPPNRGYMYEESGIFSKTGNCLPFDIEADGTVPANGVVTVILKRLKEAEIDKNNIYATIVGGAVNNDGKNRVGFTAPGINGQIELYKKALNNSKLTPKDISFIETHGTGTKIGDPIEYTSLSEVYGENPIALGSLKYHTGHLDVCSGIAGLVKTVLSLKHRKILGTSHIKNLNPLCASIKSSLYFPKETQDLTSNNSKKLIYGVNSFGLGGTNAHILLEEYRKDYTIDNSDKLFYSFPFSAKTKSSLLNYLQVFNDFIKTNFSIPVESISNTLWNGRKHFKEHHIVFVAKTLEELSECIISFIEGNTSNRKILIHESDISIKKIKNDIFANHSTLFKYKIVPELKEIIENNQLDEFKVDYIDGSTKNLEIIELSYETLKSGFFISHLESIFFSKLKKPLREFSLKNFISLPTYSFDKEIFIIKPTERKSNDKGENSEEKLSVNSIINIWKDILGVDEITESSDFFEIGGDSLSAIRFLTILQDRFQQSITLDYFLIESTPLDIFNVLKKSSNKPLELFNNKPILEIHNSRQNNKLAILIHPAGGSLLCYKYLIDELREISNLNILGIQYPKNNEYKDNLSISDISELYIKLIEPYVLGYKYVCIIGYSFGGNVGFEMARKLRDKKYNIFETFLIDTHTPMAYPETNLSDNQFNKAYSMIISKYFNIPEEDELIFEEEEKMISYYSNYLYERDQIKKDDFVRLFNIWKINHQSLKGYIQNQYTGKVTLFEAKEKESEQLLKSLNIKNIPKIEWCKYLKSTTLFKVIPVPGDHYTILNFNNIKTIAEYTKRVIKNAN